MEWIRSHPYIASLTFAAILILAGMFIVGRRAGVGPGVGSQGQNFGTWGSVNVNLLDPIGVAPEQTGNKNQESLYTQVRNGPPFKYTPLPTPTDTTAANPADDFDFDGFLASLTRPKGNAAAQTDTSLDAYSFIPGGLISTSTPAKEKTGVQSAIYEYGNNAGSYIQSYDEQYRNAPQILKDQFEDRVDAAKNARLAELGDAMAGVGVALQNIDPVPPALQPANTRLGKSYVDMGTRLMAIPAAKTDQALLDAILAYNASVETFTKNYVALATLFSAYGVTFRPDEAGSVFMFTNAAGL